MEEDVGRKYVDAFLKEYDKDKNALFDKVRLKTVIRLCENRQHIRMYRRAMSIARNKLKELI